MGWYPYKKNTLHLRPFNHFKNHPILKKIIYSFALGALLFGSAGNTNAQSPYIVHLAGNDTGGYTGDGGMALYASFRSPSSICIDDTGNIYIADGGPFGYKNDGRVRMINEATGIITTIAGLVNAADDSVNIGENIPATAAKLYGCAGICIDKAGNILIADGKSTIRKINRTTGTISTIAGKRNVTGYTGDNGPAGNALLNAPVDVAVDAANNIYIADRYNNAVRRINAVTGIITTVAGRGADGFSGDGGPASLAKLNQPHGVYLDNGNTLYIADYNNHRIRAVNPGTGIINTVVGAGLGFGGDGGPANAALLNQPVRVTKDKQGNLFIADASNQRIRRVDAATGVISTFAGTGVYFSGADKIGDNGPATAARLVPHGMCFDSCGNMLLGSVLANIRAITPTKLKGGKLCGLAIAATPSVVAAEAQQLQVYPNPTSGAFSILLPAALTQPMQITVTDITGRLISQTMSVTNKETKISLHAPAGMYLVNVTTPDARFTRKVVVE